MLGSAVHTLMTGEDPLGRHALAWVEEQHTKQRTHQLLVVRAVLDLGRRRGHHHGGSAPLPEMRGGTSGSPRLRRRCPPIWKAGPTGKAVARATARSSWGEHAEPIPLLPRPLRGCSPARRGPPRTAGGSSQTRRGEEEASVQPNTSRRRGGKIGGIGTASCSACGGLEERSGDAQQRGVRLEDLEDIPGCGVAGQRGKESAEEPNHDAQLPRGHLRGERHHGQKGSHHQASEVGG